MKLSRRHLLTGASALTALGPGLRGAFAATNANTDILVILFQRGACDWLQMLAPAGDANYIAARPTIKVTTSGTGAGFGIGSLDGTDFYLSDSAPELKALYDSGSLAFVHATGLYTADRSHFTCQAKMEKGTADADPDQNTGWLARHLAAKVPATSTFDAVSAGESNPLSLLGDANAIAVNNIENFKLAGDDFSVLNADVIRKMNGNTSPYGQSATTTLNAVDTLQSALANQNTASSSNAGYTSGALSQSLKTVAQLIRMNVGLSVATVDYGSWDMHNSLATEFRQRTQEFSQAINAFWNDMAEYRNRIIVVTMTEFGRRLYENASGGTDHGAGSGMMVLGGAVNGGRVYGFWPGLAPHQLDSDSLAVTTDYRRVLSEILVRRHGAEDISAVFPTVKYAPMEIVKTI